MTLQQAVIYVIKQDQRCERCAASSIDCHKLWEHIQNPATGNLQCFECYTLGKLCTIGLETYVTHFQDVPQNTVPTRPEFHDMNINPSTNDSGFGGSTPSTSSGSSRDACDYCSAHHRQSCTSGNNFPVTTENPCQLCRDHSRECITTPSRPWGSSCLSCRTKKSSCRGGVPCTACVARDRRCVQNDSEATNPLKKRPNSGSGDGNSENNTSGNSNDGRGNKRKPNESNEKGKRSGALYNNQGRQVIDYTHENSSTENTSSRKSSALSSPRSTLTSTQTLGSDVAQDVIPDNGLKGSDVTQDIIPDSGLKGSDVTQGVIRDSGFEGSDVTKAVIRDSGFKGSDVTQDVIPDSGLKNKKRFTFRAFYKKVSAQFGRFKKRADFYESYNSTT